MTRNRAGLAGGLALLALLAPAAQAAPRDEDALAARIDAHLAATQAKAGVSPAPLASDSEFLRRVHLDLAGRIPSVSAARTFLDSKDPDRRAKLIDSLLDGPHHVNHQVTVWRTALLPEAAANLQVRFAVPAFEGWLRRHLAANTPHDQMVRDLLTAPLDGMNPRAIPLGGDGGTGAFYLANEYLPENLASATSRLFLGVKLGCAQCHDHPFADWRRDQFWSYAAFFSAVRPRRDRETRTPSTPGRSIAIPGTHRVAQAKFLDGTAPDWSDNPDPRKALASWITSPKNPFFARATVNCLWAQLFGIGIVDPIDEMVGNDITPSQPEILDELAREFVSHKHDIKFILRTLARTQAYQRSSARGKSKADPGLFARMPLRGLSPEQLFDSLTEAVGAPHEGRDDRDPRIVLRGGGGVREEFLGKFANSSDRPTETQTSILQALTLMNGRYVADATSLSRGERLAAILDFPAWSTQKKLEALYLGALSRRPTSREVERASRHIAETLGEEGLALSEGEKDRRRRAALADVYWALLNSSEFYLNH